MRTDSGEPRATGAVRRISFWIAAGLTGAFLLLALLGTFPLLFTNWLPAEAWLWARPDRSPGDQVHRLHSLALGIISGGMLTGVLVQFHRPRRKVGALLMTAATVVALVSAQLITGTFTLAGMAPFALSVLVVCALHPEAREILRPAPMDPLLLPLALLAAVPAMIYALGVEGSAGLAGPGGELDHLTFMGALTLLVPLWGFIGATSLTGRAFPAVAAVVAGASLGLQSLIFPDALSGLDSGWAWGVLVWCVAYGGAAVRRARRAGGATGVSP